MNLRPRKIDSSMEEHKIDEKSDLLSVYRTVLRPCGMWPKENDNVHFALSCMYVLIHQILECADFVYHLGNLGEIVANLSETTSYTMVLAKVVMFHKNRILSQLIDVMKEDRANEKFRTIKEQNIYAVHYSKAKSFHNFVIILMIGTATSFYVKPIGMYLFSTNHNDTIPFVLPLRVHTFFEITNWYTYALIYVYQSGALIMVVLVTLGCNGLLILLTMHVCGQLSALAESIRNLKNDTETGHCVEIRNIVQRHVRLIWMTKRINKAFGAILLGGLLESTSLICLNGFQVVKNSESIRPSVLVAFVFYESTMMTILYGFCFVGECLIEESQRVCDACYQCSWYEMAPSQSKDLIILMVRSEKPLRLSAGKMFYFSLELFSQVIKTSAGYISVLRTLV